MRLLLHACCGPCTIEPAKFFVEQGDEITLAYVNPNIHPLSEYRRRRDTLAEYAEEKGWELIEVDYDPSAWLREAGVHGTDRSRRCRACYRVRFEQVARIASEQGFDAISTTLSVSPYQDVEGIREQLEAAAMRWGVEARFEDFRDRYPEATRISRELGMYRQNYCGCLLSEVEADTERAERRAERATRKRGE